MTTIAPNETLYINGLNDKISKQDLRRGLYYIFSQFGKVLDVVALKTMDKRGQAFVCFNDIESATEGMRSLQGFPIFEKPMNIHYAKKKSNVIKIRDGTILSRRAEKRVYEDEDDEDTRKRIRQLEEENANELLFVSNLPSTTTEDQLVALFQNYPGFKEVRAVPGKAEIAFVEYESSEHALVAKNVLNGFQITPAQSIQVQFAKR